MRKSCFDCARKHLAQALVISMELRYYAGDPEDDHLWLCVGHLAEAADQIQGKSVFIADKIRDQRLTLMREGADSVNKLSLNNLIQLISDLAREESAVKPTNALGIEMALDDLGDVGSNIQKSNGSV